MEKIIIKREEEGTFIVYQGDKDSGSVTYDEMLGLVTQLTMPEDRHCLRWMKTKKEQEAQRKFWSPDKVADSAEISVKLPND